MAPKTGKTKPHKTKGEKKKKEEKGLDYSMRIPSLVECFRLVSLQRITKEKR